MHGMPTIEQKLSQAGGNGADDWLLAILFCPELQIDRFLRI
jgi:hypothetical protein